MVVPPNGLTTDFDSTIIGAPTDRRVKNATDTHPFLSIRSYSDHPFPFRHSGVILRDSLQIPFLVYSKSYPSNLLFVYVCCHIFLNIKFVNKIQWEQLPPAM